MKQSKKNKKYQTEIIPGINTRDLIINIIGGFFAGIGIELARQNSKKTSKKTSKKRK